MFFLYQIIISIIILLSPLIILIRILKNKEDVKRFKEKFCLFSKKKVTGKLIWFHGASVGELLSLIPIIYKLEKDSTIKQISNRGFQIKNAIDWRKFTSGAI